MLRRCTLVFSLILTLTAFRSEAQDPHFSQFYANPLYLNPAMTGVFDGNFRFTAGYREQWTSILASVPFRTVTAGFERRIHLTGNDAFTVGFNALYDQAGSSHFQHNKGGLSLSYMKQLSGARYRNQDQYLIAGIQLGAGQNSIDYNNLWFSSQFDQGTVSVDPDLNSGEPAINHSTNVYLDFNAGLMWYATFDDNMSIYFGGALNHINGPAIGFIDGSTETLYRRWVGHAGGELPVTDEFSLLPAIVVMGQGPSFQTNGGLNFRYSNNDWREIAIRAGIWSRISNTFDGVNMDAMIVSAILEMERWTLGISYDINASSLTTVSQSRGAYEISFSYVHPASRRFKVNCPNF